MNWMMRACERWQPGAPRTCFGLDTLFNTTNMANDGAAQAQQANYMAQVARNNQTIAERNAALALQQGETQATQRQQKTAQMIGSQRAALASQGADINSGSPLDVQTDTARAGAYGVANDRYNANLNAYKFHLAAANQEAAANDYATQAANARARTSARINQTLLGGGSSNQAGQSAMLMFPPT